MMNESDNRPSRRNFLIRASGAIIFFTAMMTWPTAGYAFYPQLVLRIIVRATTSSSVKSVARVFGKRFANGALVAATATELSNLTVDAAAAEYMADDLVASSLPSQNATSADVPVWIQRDHYNEIGFELINTTNEEKYNIELSVEVIDRDTRVLEMRKRIGALDIAPQYPSTRTLKIRNLPTPGYKEVYVVAAELGRVGQIVQVISLPGDESTDAPPPKPKS